MMRGILLLILSCVVLTLQTTTPTCTCQQNQPVSEIASNWYPIPAVTPDNVKWTQPADVTQSLADLATRCGKMNGKGFLGETETSDVLDMQKSGNGIIDGLTSEIEELLSLQVEVRAAIALLKVDINTDLSGLLALVDSIIDPLTAAEHCSRALYIRSRLEYCDRLDRYLDICIGAKINLKILWVTYQRVVGIVLGLCQTLDGLLSTCLPILPCNRGGLLGSLSSGLVNSLLTEVGGLIQSVASVQVQLQANITNNPDLWVSVTVDDKECDLIQSALWSVWGSCENLLAIPFSLVQSILAEVAHDVGILLDIVLTLLSGFTLGPNRQFVCTGYTDPNAKTCTCTLTTKIILDVGVNIDLNVAAEKLASTCRVGLLALTGCFSVDARVLSCSNDGTVSIQVILNADAHDLIQDAYEITNVVNTCGITSILGGVTQALLPALEPQTGIASTVSRLIPTAVNLVEGVTQMITGSLSRLDVLNTNCETALNTIKSSTDPKEIAQVARDTYLASESNEIDNMKTQLAYFQQNKATADAKVASCQNEMSQDKSELDANSGNPDYTDRYPTIHQTQSDHMKQLIGIQLQLGSMCDTMQSQIDVNVANLASLQISLDNSLTGIVNSVVTTLSTLRVQLHLKITAVVDNIIGCIQAFRPSCGTINVNFLNLSVTTDPTIQAQVTILDVLSPVEVLLDVRAIHCSMIRAAFILMVGNINVQVEVQPVASDGSCPYLVTIG